MLAVIGAGVVPGLEDVPNVMDLVSQDNPRRPIMNAIVVGADLGLSLIAPPGVPEDRVKFLREVVDRTMNDPELIAEAAPRGIPLNYADGDWLAALIQRDAQPPEDVRAWFRSLATAAK